MARGLKGKVNRKHNLRVRLRRRKGRGRKDLAVPAGLVLMQCVPAVAEAWLI